MTPRLRPRFPPASKPKPRIHPRSKNERGNTRPPSHPQSRDGPFGDADLATHRAMTRADHFRIGSNTKTFVISVLLQLVDEGKLGLDDKLSKFDLGVAIPNAENITVRELCEIRSGLFEAYDTPEIDRMKITPDMKFDARTLVGWAVQQKPLFAPGTKYNYSNTNYLLLGLIIETVTKDSIADQIRTRLLEPFHLTETSYPTTEAMPARA